MDPAESVLFLPLGGLGEIGMNCFALQQRGQVLVVDCGAAFPDDDMGVDVIVPDFTWLVEHQRDIVGVFVTHGHEDHIGGVHHLLRRLERDVPVYAPAHACALMARRFAENDIDPGCLHTVETGATYFVGSFAVEPIHVAHSIVGATSLCIDTVAGKIVHTADFNLDDEQPAGAPTDERRFRELGREGVRLLLSDSTNIDTPERSASEGDVARTLHRLLSSCSQRMVVGMFSSNAHRLVALGQAARETGRKMCLMGRSLIKQFEVAQELGIIQFPSNLLVAADDVAALPAHRVLVVAGGSQGEPSSALRRLSQRSHPQLQLDEGDTVVLSARIIPGNEKPVHAMIDDFSRQGVRVLTSRDDAVHTSGHASRVELRAMIEWTCPQAFVPVHGTVHHLQRHRELAAGWVDDTAVVENGQPLSVSRHGSLVREAAVHSGKVRVAFGGEEMSPRVRRRRGEMARRGIIFVTLTLNQRRELLSAPRVTSVGVVGVDDDVGALSVLQNALRQVTEHAPATSPAALEQRLIAAVRTRAKQMCSTRPRVEVHVCQLDV